MEDEQKLSPRCNDLEAKREPQVESFHHTHLSKDIENLSMKIIEAKECFSSTLVAVAGKQLVNLNNWGRLFWVQMTLFSNIWTAGASSITASLNENEIDDYWRRRNERTVREKVEDEFQWRLDHLWLISFSEYVVKNWEWSMTIPMNPLSIEEVFQIESYFQSLTMN